MTTQIFRLADLQAADPQHKQNKPECDCCCPLCSDGKRPGPANRTLSYNSRSGAWKCHRCGAKGILADFQTQEFLPRQRHSPARQQLQRLVTRSEKPAAADVEADNWKSILAGLQSLADTPGAPYLEGRGIPLAVAVTARVRFHPDFFGRPAVIFAIRDGEGNLTAINGRYIDNKVDAAGNKLLTQRTCNRFDGGLKRGVFATPGAWEAPAIVITEAPIDALSLQTAGVPTIALCGVALREGLLAYMAWKTVHLAFDNDAANAQGKRPGEEAYLAWEAALMSYGTRVERLRPAGVKDWNAALQTYGVEAMQKALAVLYAAPQELEPVVSSFTELAPAVNEEAGQRVYNGAYVFIEDLALQDWLPRKFRAVPGGPVVDMNAWVRQAVIAQDAVLLEQIEAAFEAWRKPLLAAMNEPDWW